MHKLGKLHLYLLSGAELVYNDFIRSFSLAETGLMKAVTVSQRKDFCYYKNFTFNSVYMGQKLETIWQKDVNNVDSRSLLLLLQLCSIKIPSI